MKLLNCLLTGSRVILKKQQIFTLILFIVLSVFAATSVIAAEGGYSNYIPGTYGDFAAAVEPPTKLTIRNDVYFYNADSERSVRSGQVEVDAELEFIMDFLTILYKTDMEILGAHYAFGTFIPFSYIDIESGIHGANRESRVQEDVFGLGDIVFIPAVLFWNHNDFHFTFTESVITPTGSYNSADLVNTSLNYWTFDSNVAVTYLNLETGQDYSINIGHTYNTENSDTDYQTGQELHIDYMINQFLSETWAIGLQGFYLKQLTGDSGDGALLGDFKGEAAGIGPALLWITKIAGKDISFIAKWLHEFHAENRIEGDHLMLSFAMSL